MDEDWQQLATYVTQQRGADEAFAAIVNRYINLVFSAALRQMNDRSAAEEVTQAVFLLLSKKAPELEPTGSLGSWLYNAASLKAKEQLRSDLARRKREQKAYDMANNDVPDDNDALDWDRVAPLLDTAMGDLPDADREALLMRFFQNQPLREVGESLGVSEDAARKRVARAVDRLRGWFAERGVAFSVVALTSGIAARAVEAAPAHLANSTIQAVAANTATTTTTSIITTMASTKFTAIAAVLIGAAIPISLAYVKHEPSAEIDVPSPSLPALVVDLPEPADSELIAEWKRLRAEFGPDVGSMPQLYAAVKKIDDRFRRRAFRGALIAEWAALDGAGALAYFQKNDKHRIAALIGDWLECDPQAAIAALKAGGKSLKDHIKARIEEIATQFPESLPELAVHVERRNPWDQQVTSAFAIYARQDFSAARQMAEGMDGQAASEALAGIAGVWAERDGEAAFAWVKALESEAVRGRAMQGLLIGWAKIDPRAALERIDLAPVGGSGFSAYSTADQVVKAAAEKDFDAVIRWMGERKDTGHSSDNGFEGVSDILEKRFLADVAGTVEFIRDSEAQEPLANVLNNILLNDGYREHQAVWDWAMQQPQSDFVKNLRQSLMRSVAYKNPFKAIELYQSLPEGIDYGDQHSGIAQPLLNGGHDKWRLAGLLEVVTERKLRSELLVMAISHPDATLDGPLWVARLGEFPDEMRSMAVENIASGWSLQDPQSAIAFANGLDDEGERLSAYVGLAAGWAGADSWEASEWVAGMDEGAERDAAILGLVRNIGESDPDAAWEWANSATVPSQREQAVAAAIQALVMKNPSLAESRLQASPGLSPDLRQGLRQQIEFYRSNK